VISETFLYSDTGVIEDDLLRGAAEVFKPRYDAFEEAFLVLPIKCGNKNVAAETLTHTPYLYLLFAATEDNSAFVNKNLSHSANKKLSQF
jgi:hypothetical protein